jgi:tetratricopeptide (TPR) repeat protein
MQFYDGNKADGIRLMTEAANMEDATEKHPGTPCEVIPARELLGDMYMEHREFAKALEAYEADLKRHAGRFNGLYGAAIAAKRAGQTEKAATYFEQLKAAAHGSDGKRSSIASAELIFKQNI